MPPSPPPTKPVAPQFQLWRPPADPDKPPCPYRTGFIVNIKSHAVAKIYDPLYYSFYHKEVSSVPCDVTRFADQDYSREAAAYEHLDAVGQAGSIAPKQRRLILIEYLPGKSIRELCAGPVPAAAAFDEAYRLEILARILDDEANLRFKGINHNDLAACKVILHALLLPKAKWQRNLIRKHEEIYMPGTRDTAEAAARIVLACFEASAMLAAILLWLLLPVALFAAWAGACAVIVAVACWMLKDDDVAGRTNRVNFRESGGWIKGQEAKDERWMFVGGMGMSFRHCHEKILSALSRLFNRPVTCNCMSPYGILFDMMAMVLQRCVPMPSQVRRTLYTQMRCALLDDSVDRCVALCHNDGAVLVSQAVTQLCADLSPERLDKLEVYTCGAAASEFVVPPRNTITTIELKPVRQNGDRINDQLGIHLEHFAMQSDPFA
ncbi:hypothetical protein VTI28DRAFT_9709 [Corynascus sepedonium]